MIFFLLSINTSYIIDRKLRHNALGLCCVDINLYGVHVKRVNLSTPTFYKRTGQGNRSHILIGSKVVDTDYANVAYHADTMSKAEKC